MDEVRWCRRQEGQSCFLVLVVQDANEDELQLYKTIITSFEYIVWAMPKLEPAIKQSRVSFFRLRRTSIVPTHLIPNFVSLQ